MIYIKTTFNLRREYKDQLNELVKANLISSTTEGINQAIELFIKDKKRQQYMEKMAEAANDKRYIERTMTVQKEFDAFEIDATKEGQEKGISIL